MNNLKIYYGNSCINDEELLNKLYEFSSEIISNEINECKNGVVLHTGSFLYDAIIISCAYLNMVVNSTYSSVTMIESLKEGDMVVFEDSRQQFCGKTRMYGEVHVTLKNETGTVHVMPKSWHKIKKYYGDSKSLDSRGIAQKKNVDSIQKLAKGLVSESDEFLFSNLDSALVICMSRERAEDYYHNISFSFEDGAKSRVKLSDIATMTYYTENDEYQIGRNILKNEACLQVASDVSVARNLMRRRTKIPKYGAIVCGDEIFSQSEDDIKDIVTRKNLTFSFLSTNISSRFVSSIVKDYSDANYFPCTKDFLLTYGGFEHNTRTEINKQFSDEINTSIDVELSQVVLQGQFTWEMCSGIRRDIHYIANDYYESEEKDHFVIYSNALLNLLIRSAFTISEMTNSINKGEIDVKSVPLRLIDLKKWMQFFPANIKDKAISIIDKFEVMINISMNSCLKEDYLEQFIRKNSDKSIAIVVDKKYYSTIMQGLSKYKNPRKYTKLYITTPNRFDNSRIFDYIFVVGWIDGKNFNPLRCNNAIHIMSLLYQYESKILNVKIKKNKQHLSFLNEKSKFEVETDIDFNETVISAEEEKDVEEFIVEDSETVDIVEKLRRKYITRGFSFNTAGYACSTAVKTIKLDSREVVFLSKNYKAYVYDSVNNSIHETAIDKLCEGDTLVFTSSSSATNDIVEIIMDKRLSENKYSADVCNVIEKSRYWKDLVKNYQETTHISDEEICKKLKTIGISVVEQTILGWLDKDSHTICPQKIESLIAIGKLCEDIELQKNAEFYYNCCSEVKSIRRGILKEIAAAIRGNIIENTSNVNKDVYDIVCQSDNLVVISSIEYITDIPPQEVPVNKINRPLKQGV